MPSLIAVFRRLARPLIGIGLIVIAIYAGLLIVVFLILSWSTQPVEKMRASDASSTLDAVLAEVNAGATVATATHLYLLPKGEQASGAPVFVADHAIGMTVSWADGATVVLKADKARVFRRSERETVWLGYFERKTVEIKYEISKEER